MLDSHFPTYPCTFEGLKQATNEFFDRNWVAGAIEQCAPTWSNPYHFVGSIPNNERQGVYAFLADDQVYYIGVGASRNSGRYEGAGIGARTTQYFRVARDHRKTPVEIRRYELVKNWGGVNSMVTLGFERSEAYLSYSLEAFLISRLEQTPIANINRPGQ
jgi:hypothetical protein